MGVATAETLARAIELDDGLPLDVCPGCGKDITGWERWRGHYSSERRTMSASRLTQRAGEGMPWPFSDSPDTQGGLVVCVWTRDFLVSRAFRRRLIETGDIP